MKYLSSVSVMCLCYSTLLSFPVAFSFLSFSFLYFSLLWYSSQRFSLISTNNLSGLSLPPLNMAGQSITKRPVVFTWAELQKYPTLEARYAETVPFRDRPVHPCDDWCYPPIHRKCNCQCNDCNRFMENLAKCIKRTGERWAVSIFSELYLWPPSSHVLVMSHGSILYATKHS